MFMYQKKMEMLMNEKKMTRRRIPNDGAVQILKGRIGSCATFISQYEKAAKQSMETMSKAMLYGASHPTKGAWL